MRRHKRAIGYARVSSAEQAVGTSLRDQEALIRSYATSQGLPVAHVYIEAESGVGEKLERREQMAALLRDVRDGDIILCDKVDRWSRDPEFTLRSIREAKERGASWYAIGDACDPSEEHGRLMLHFRNMFAEAEHRRIRERMIGTRERLRARGYWVEGVVPFGYRRPYETAPKGAEKNILVVVEGEAEQVRRWYAMAIEGAPLSRIVADCGATRDVVRAALHRRFYTGCLESPSGEWIRGLHPAIVDVATFTRAQDAMASRRHGSGRKAPHDARTSTWILRDVARCGLCGAKASASYGQTQGYYRCSASCTRRYVSVRAVEPIASVMVLDRLTEIRRELAAHAESKSAPRAVDYADRRAKLAAKRARVVDAFTDGAIDREEMRRRMGKLDDELLRLDVAEAAVAKPLADPAKRREVLASVEAIERAWVRLDPLERRDIVGRLALEARLVAGQPPAVVWRDIADLSTD